MSAQAPNVLFLMSDQHRAATTGCYGGAVETPHIDGLAEAGTRFENAFCSSPLCGPSRASFLTGTHPHTNGSITHSNSRHRTGRSYRPQRRDGIHSLVRCLRDSGYRTHASGYLGVDAYDGDRPLGQDPDFVGFDTFGARQTDYEAAFDDDVVGSYHDDVIHGEMWEPSYFNVQGDPFPHEDHQLYDSFVAEDARQFITDQSDAEDPFCLYVGFRAPHPPWRAPEEFHEAYDPAAIESLPNWQDPPIDRKPRRLVERHQYFDVPHYSEEMVRRSIAAYRGFVSYVDDCVGRVLEQLEASGLREDTIVVYCSDHGENLYRHGLCEKHTFYEDAVRVPLILSRPGHLPEGQRTDSLASLMDVLPTILRLTDTPWPEFVEGVDLQPALYGDDVREYVYAEYYHTLDPCRMIRGQRYKYVHTEDDVDELYDLDNDPGERHNLAWYEAYADLVGDMEERVMEGWEIPEVPLWAAWNDLNERKQHQLRDGVDVIDTHPTPEWVADSTHVEGNRRD
jgi:choline-sulfatase